MLIRRLKVSGLLSFGPKGIDLPMEPLNVLIGPNGSGKSNLLEVLALLRAAPRNLAEPVRRRGGIWEWLWKGETSPGEASVEAIVYPRSRKGPLRHALTMADNGGRLEVTAEEIAYRGGSAAVRRALWHRSDCSGRLSLGAGLPAVRRPACIQHSPAGQCGVGERR